MERGSGRGFTFTVYQNVADEMGERIVRPVAAPLLPMWLPSPEDKKKQAKQKRKKKGKDANPVPTTATKVKIDWRTIA